MQNKELLDYYNNNAKLLSKKFSKSGAREKDIKAILALVNKNNPKILEIGCGDGRDAEIILKYTKNYTGIDFSDQMIDLARKRLPKTTFEVAGMNEFSFPENCDIIISFASIVHSNKSEVKEVLEKGHKALAGNGIFHISAKHGSYSKKRFEDDLGAREFYYYCQDDLDPFLKDYKILKSTKVQKNNQAWFELTLQKA